MAKRPFAFKTLALCLLAACVTCAATGSSSPSPSIQVEVRVRQTAGGPQIHVDGEPVAPHMFWGRETMARLPVSGEWRHVSIDYTPALDIERPRLRLEVPLRPGTLEVRGLSFGSCTTGIVEIAAGTDAKSGQNQFWPGRFTKGVTQRLSFDVRSDDLAWMRPCVEQTEEGPYKYFAVEIPPDGAELLTLVSQTRKARAAGVRFVTFYAPNCWMPEGEENWEPIDRIIRELMEVSPDILAIPRVTLNAPAWWTEMHPEARMVMEGGRTSSYASVSSRLYRREACAYVERLVRHLMEAFPHNFAGIHPTGQNTNEWFYWDSWSRLCGYDPATREAFRDWLAAHGDPDAATADVPPVCERKPQSPPSCLLNPVANSRVVAFNRYLQDEMCDFVAEVAETCRRASEGKKLVVVFYGYGWEFSRMSHGPAASGHYALGRLLDEAGNSIDILAAPNSYNGDRGWLGSTPQMAAVETIMRRGILWVAEDDTRTYVDLDFLPPGAKPNYSGLSTREETCDVLRRNLAQQIVRGTGSWWMDLFGRGWYDDQKLWNVVRDFCEADKLALGRAAPYAPAVAHISDEESMLFLAANSDVGSSLLGNARPAFARIGAPCGQYLLADVLRDPINAPLQVLPVWYADGEKAAALAALRTRQPDVTRLWCWAPAWLGPDGGDMERMSQVTGFSFTRLPKGGRRVVSTADGVAAGLPAEWGGTIANDVDPRFAAETRPGDEVWAAWPDGGAAVVLRPHSGGVGHEVFCGTPELPQHLLAALARKSGARLLTETPERTIALESDGFASVQALEDGGHSLDVGTEDPVSDAITGEVVGHGPRLTLPLRAGEARLLAW